MTPTDIASHVHDIVHEETQSRDAGVDLTAEAVYEVVEPGRVDFGGGELDDADLSPVEGSYRNPDDDYQWWNLSRGQYLLQYNESLSGDHRFVLQPHPNILERGAFHPTLHASELPRVPLAVGGGGIRVKENARVSTLVPPRQ